MTWAQVDIKYCKAVARPRCGKTPQGQTQPDRRRKLSEVYDTLSTDENKAHGHKLETRSVHTRKRAGRAAETRELTSYFGVTFLQRSVGIHWCRIDAANMHAAN